MNEDQERQNYFKQVLGAAFQLEADAATSHLSEEEAWAFYQGQLPSAVAIQRQSHCLSCIQCQQLLQEVRDFCAPADGDEIEVPATQMQASWEKLSAKLPVPNTEAASAAPVAPPSTGKSFAMAAGGWRWGALITVLAVLVAGAVWCWKMLTPATPTAQLAGASSPTPAASAQSATPLLETPAQIERKTAPLPQTAGTATSAPRRAATPAASQPYSAGELLVLSGDRAGESNSQVAPRRIPIEAQSFRLKLKKYAPREFAVYRVELLDAQGTVRQTVTGKPGADNQIEVVFSCAGLPAGEYLVRVSGMPESATPLHTQADRTSYEGKLKLTFVRQ